MKISRHDKLLLVEQEILALFLIIVLGAIFYSFMKNYLFYAITLLLGFVFYFWMFYEEKVHKTGKKHAYFEHTSSYIMLAQTSLALGLFFVHFSLQFLILTFSVISVIMYSVSLSRILMYKAVFKK